jgi:hypothetical protein
VGKFDDADPLTEIFARNSRRQLDGRFCALDMHHCVHPEITLFSETSAAGRWTLRFRHIDLARHTELIGSGEYEDAYVVEDDAWKVSASRLRIAWSMSRPLSRGTVIA